MMNNIQVISKSISNSAKCRLPLEGMVKKLLPNYKIDVCCRVVAQDGSFGTTG